MIFKESVLIFIEITIKTRRNKSLVVKRNICLVVDVDDLRFILELQLKMVLYDSTIDYLFK